MFAPVYLDHNATTPLDPQVREAMLPYLGERFGNASSRHEYGRHARAAIDTARAQVAAALGAHPTEVVFTSGGSEANNLFLKGAAAMLKPGRVAVSAIEHPCVRESARRLVKQGWAFDEIGVDAQGVIDAADFAEKLSVRPQLVSIMLANNETGVLQDIESLASKARSQGARIHTDAVQALGKVPVDFRGLGVNALTVSAHKIYGPIGVGALVVDKRVELAPLIDGGGQERGLRSGTENLAAIVGFGLACELAESRRVTDALRLAQLKESLEEGLGRLGATVFSAGAARLAGTSFFAFSGVDGETLVGKLDRAGFACASGSACSSANPEPSKTLLAMGVAPDVARGAIRVSVGRATMLDEVDRFVGALSEELNTLRGLTAMAN
ncbi:MAG TPA: cysteine desulfurase family protein [Denitromonas sp.]|uniref:cysteine desulfurase family protein n=1 Tax=Denitromonas sp. TaxID=2734609 RepID=UPI001D1DCC70|nr:cysteine desulfurase [Rhodocyclaceae bacterium]MCP5220628.1 cysteine desulfurase [Zoogloeaceae bacterium]HPR08685.1 cysteine desulfurase family protein [Denitromonas sp.]HQU87680.1 cysteine desulfurase family protein [Denitromonas sp.]HQV13805.1 cysteine desulfurase family protein [Denitromonas sp.]